VTNAIAWRTLQRAAPHQKISESVLDEFPRHRRTAQKGAAEKVRLGAAFKMATLEQLAEVSGFGGKSGGGAEGVSGGGEKKFVPSRKDSWLNFPMNIQVAVLCDAATGRQRQAEPPRRVRHDLRAADAGGASTMRRGAARHLQPGDEGTRKLSLKFYQCRRAFHHAGHRAARAGDAAGRRRIFSRAISS